jgi:hypothetical protein
MSPEQAVRSMPAERSQERLVLMRALKRLADLETRLREMAGVPCVKHWGGKPMKCFPTDRCSFCRARALMGTQ